MKRTNFRAMLLFAAGLCLSAGVSAQTMQTASAVSDKYLISAKAGGVNYVEGAVTVKRVDGKSGILLRRDRVEIGDQVTTGGDGRAEVLLNPGSYIRLGSNSSFEFGTTDLEDLQIKLDSGSAIFEVFAANEFRVSVTTPKGRLSLIESGVYRVDVGSDGNAVLAVTKGKAEVGQSETLVKDGRTGTVGNDSVVIAKFDKDKRDGLAEWSRSRSKELTKMASSFRDRQLSTSLLNSFNRGQWGIYDSFGLWVYNASFGGHCFLPFGYGWRSPYGGWYRNGINWYNLPQIYTRPVNPATPPTSDPSWAMSKQKRTTPPTVVSGSSMKSGRGITRDVYSPPPFTKIHRERDNSGFGGDFSTKGSSEFPSMRSAPPVNVSIPVVTPSSSTMKGRN